MRGDLNVLPCMVGLCLLCFFQAGKAFSSETPFELAGGIILVKASVNRMVPSTFILDTGATECLLVPQAAKLAGLGPTMGDGSPLANSVAVGDQVVPAIPFLVADPLQAISLRLDRGINYAGILGYPFLSKCVFRIDYRRKTLDWFGGTGRDPAFHAPRNAICVPFSLRSRLIHVSGLVNGRGPVTFLVDTGSAEVVLLPKAAEFLRVPVSPGNRNDGVRFTTLDRIAVGKAIVTKTPAIVCQLQREGIGTLSYDGILGYPFLSHFRTTFNYGDKTLELEPIPAPP